MQFELHAPIPTMAQKKKLQEKLDADKAAFFAAGGEIQEIPVGEPSTFTWDGVWLDHDEAAAKLGVPLSQLKNSVMNGSLASCPAPISYIRGGRRMWPEAVIDSWKEKYGHHVKARTRAFKDGKKGTPL